MWIHIDGHKQWYRLILACSLNFSQCLIIGWFQTFAFFSSKTPTCSRRRSAMSARRFKITSSAKLYILVRLFTYDHLNNLVELKIKHKEWARNWRSSELLIGALSRKDQPQHSPLGLSVEPLLTTCFWVLKFIFWNFSMKIENHLKVSLTLL